MKNLNNMNKSTKKNMVTYGIVLAMFIFCVVYTTTGMASHLFRGLLVPVCVNVILAISLNLTVGILGELSLGHAGFMCVGAFVGSVFSMAAEEESMLPPWFPGIKQALLPVRRRWYGSWHGFEREGRGRSSRRGSAR